MSDTEKRNLERVQYWQGQMLRSRDFNDIHAAEEQRRWWHNRALHNAYGVYQDDPKPFTVTPNADNSAVTVAPGLAYDSFGRELVLQTERKIPLPAALQDKDEYLLLIRYRMQQPNDRRDNVAGVCYTDDVPPSPGSVEFIWKRPDQCAFTDGVPLKKLIVGHNPPLEDLPSPPFIRPLSRPQLGSGSTVAGNTPWELWTSGQQVQRGLQIYGVQTTIDTSAAGFTDAPCYFAWLQGNVFNPQSRRLARALFTSIAEESVNSFVFRIAFPQQPQIIPEITLRLRAAAANPQPVSYVSPEDFALFAHQQGLYVNWVGCQKNASAPFFFSWLRNPGFLLGLNVLRFAKFSIHLKDVLPAIEMPE